MPNDSDPTQPDKTRPPCSGLSSQELAVQKYGWPQDNTSCPPAAHQLHIVRDFALAEGRLLQLRQCPTCHTYCLYRTDYTFSAGGSEDEEYLTQLTNAEAPAYLQRPAPE